MSHTVKRANCYLGLVVNGDLGGVTMYTSRRGQIVSFPKSPPLCPPTARQIANRTAFRLAAATWNVQPIEVREKWNAAAKRAKCVCTGYNLWVHWKVTADPAYIRTIETQSGIALGV